MVHLLVLRPFEVNMWTRSLYILCLLGLIYAQEQHRRLAAVSDEDYEKVIDQHLANFEPHKDVYVLGPSAFPQPTDRALKSFKDVVVPYLTPEIGKHRPNKDVVMAYAAEYGIKNYVLFVESLRETGFDGDIVLAVHGKDLRDPEIKAYLSSKPGVVVYAPNQVCFNFENEEVESAKGGIRTCICHHLYARQHKNGTLTPLEDIRPQRTLANTRYEIYWIMAHNYQKEVWMLLVDARDTVFQTNPFVDVPRQTDPSGASGLLYYFGENMDATRLGLSKMNKKWLKNAYGTATSEMLKDNPTICSGATMGEQIAIETYLRAMVAEADETGTVLMGSDQGFHNRLYYSSKLLNADKIHDIVVFDQGTGIVNNLGALRTQALETWGNGKIVKTTQQDGQTIYQVLNWDGTPSPVVHQFDRHKALSDYFFKKVGGEYYRKWNEDKQGGGRADQ